jgi:hypothetical protein
MNTLRDSRQSIHSIAFSCRPKSLCMNTLRNSSQDIHSIILRGKVLRTKELSGELRLGPPVLAFDWFSKTDAGAARGAAFAAPESGSGPLSLISGSYSGREENAPRKTKVTPTPGIARLGAPFLVIPSGIEGPAVWLGRGFCFTGPLSQEMKSSCHPDRGLQSELPTSGTWSVSSLACA